MNALSGSQTPNPADDETELQVRRQGNGNGASEGFLQRKTSQLLEVVSLSTAHGSDPGPSLMPHIAAFVDAYAASEIAAAIRADIQSVAQPVQRPEGSDELPDVTVESELLRGRKRATWVTQFRILSGRAFKNMYRDPALLTFQYSASIAAARESSLNIDWCTRLLNRIGIAVLCGLFYHNVSDDIGGFQNRLGVKRSLLGGELSLILYLQVFSSSLWLCLAFRAYRV
jgi:hypothetical protein